MNTQTYNFTVTFTRPDEQDAHVYTIGYNADAADPAAAEAKLRLHFDHLTVRAVTLSCVMDDDGNVTVWACPQCGVCGSDEQCPTCQRGRQQIAESAALQAYMEAHEPPTGWYDEAHLREEWRKARTF